MYRLKAYFFNRFRKVFVNDSAQKNFKHKTCLQKCAFQVCYETCSYYASPPRKVACKGEMKSTHAALSRLGWLASIKKQSPYYDYILWRGF